MTTFDRLPCIPIEGAKANKQTYFGVATALITDLGHHAIIITHNKEEAAKVMEEIGATEYEPKLTHAVAVMQADNVILDDEL